MPGITAGAELPILIQSVSIGLAVAAPVGPMSTLCISRTLANGRRAGLVFGAGIAAGDAAYAAVAAFGITAITSAVMAAGIWIKLVGSLALIYLGTKIAFTPPNAGKPRDAATPGIKSFVTAFALTLANPPTLLFFASIFASISAFSSFVESALFSAGVLAGSMLWWIVLTTLVAKTAAFLKPQTAVWINRISGAALIAFACYGLLVVAWQRP